MAILGLAEDLHDVRHRLHHLTIGYAHLGQPVTAGDLKAAEAMTAILKEAIKPTLMQTTEHTPVLVHTGPFANIAHRNSSIIADWIGRHFTDYVATESGFGADLGMKKFFDITCRASGMLPDAVVMVCTVRALKMHSVHYHVVAGYPLDPALVEANPQAIEEGPASCSCDQPVP
jgi:formate--tetrahydrofolate ligase